MGVVISASAVLAFASAATAATPLDSGYGSAGLTTTVWKTLSIPVVEEMLVQPDGKLLVAGTAIPDPFVNHSYGDLIVGRLLANGTPDPDFGTNGRSGRAARPELRLVLHAALRGDGAPVDGQDRARGGTPEHERVRTAGARATDQGRGDRRNVRERRRDRHADRRRHADDPRRAWLRTRGTPRASSPEPPASPSTTARSCGSATASGSISSSGSARRASSTPPTPRAVASPRRSRERSSPRPRRRLRSATAPC